MGIVQYNSACVRCVHDSMECTISS